MKRNILSLIFLLNAFIALSQNHNKAPINYFEKDTVFETNVVYDFFREEFDSIIYIIGSVFLMPSDSILFCNPNKYTIQVVNPQNGYLNIYYKEKKLFSYSLFNHNVKGTGYCYYPFIGNVALQGRFVDGRLNGLIFIQKENGKLLEAMKFDKGCYEKHIYHWLSFDDEELRNRSLNRSSNPLRNDEVIER